MESISQYHYQVLQIIYSIVKDDLYPLKYQIHPREIILRSMEDWSKIQAALSVLEENGWIVTRTLDTLQISMTQAGLQICRSPILK
jgi:hypothetical protein